MQKREPKPRPLPLSTPKTANGPCKPDGRMSIGGKPLKQ